MEKMKVFQAIKAVQRELSTLGIGKDKKNTHQNYNFRGIDDVYDVLSVVLAKYELCIMPRMVGRTWEERTTKKGDSIFHVSVEAEYDFISSEDGSIYTAKTYGEAMDSGDKATNKAMSAAYKYMCFQAFSIPVKAHPDLPDADGSTPESSLPKNSRNNATQHKNNVDDIIVPIHQEIIKIRERDQFVWYVNKELPRKKLKIEERRVVFGLCAKHAETLGLVFLKSNKSWITKEEFEGMGEGALNKNTTH